MKGKRSRSKKCPKQEESNSIKPRLRAFENGGERETRRPFENGNNGGNENLPYVRLPPPRPPVERHAAVLRAARPRAAPALLRRRSGRRRRGRGQAEPPRASCVGGRARASGSGHRRRSCSRRGREELARDDGVGVFGSVDERGRRRRGRGQRGGGLGRRRVVELPHLLLVSPLFRSQRESKKGSLAPLPASRALH
jgi:hypothetical protein